MRKLGFILFGLLGGGIISSCSATDNGANNFGGSSGSSASGSGASGGFIVGGSSGMSGSAGGLGLDGGCAQASGNAENLPAVIQVVLDISGSMDDGAPGGGTKMEVTRDALRAAIPLLPDSTALGTYYYPNPSGTPCVLRQVAVPVQLLTAPHRQAIDSSLSTIVASGNTPTHDAFVVGAQQLNQVTLPGNKFILLMTDGQPTLGVNCDPLIIFNLPQAYNLLVQQVAQAAAGGIRTFVVGSPGSEGARDLLSRMATAGGTAPAGCSDTGPNYCHFDMTTQPNLSQALSAALSAIAGQALSCVYNIPQDNANVNPELVSIYYTPGGSSQAEEIGKSQDPNNCVDGWKFSDDRKQIILCGATCDRVKADQTGTVNVVFGCRPKFT